MAPSVIRSKNDIVIKTNDKDLKDIKKKLTETQKFIKKNFNYVGENFAYKAREIHYQNKKNLQGIYGLATKEEFKELKEEGIEAEIIPWIKDKAN